MTFLDPRGAHVHGPWSLYGLQAGSTGIRHNPHCWNGLSHFYIKSLWLSFPRHIPFSDQNWGRFFAFKDSSDGTGPTWRNQDLLPVAMALISPHLPLPLCHMRWANHRLWGWASGFLQGEDNVLQTTDKLHGTKSSFVRISLRCPWFSPTPLARQWPHEEGTLTGL